MSDNSSFKKPAPAQTQAKPVMREFTVGSPEDFQQSMPSMDELESRAREINRQRLENVNKITDVAKKRIEILANIGKLTKDVEIGGYSFTIKTLKAKETREAAVATFATSLTQIEASYEARKQQLARSIIKIDGQNIEDIIGGASLEDKIKFIEEHLEDVVVEKLWNEFVSLKEESKTKYGINTQKDSEEVSEDLKK